MNVLLQFIVGISLTVIAILICVGAVIAYKKYKKGKNSYLEWNKIYKVLAISLIIIVPIFIIGISLLLNCFYKIGPIKLESDLKNAEGFSLVIGLATLCSTIIIAVFQLFAQKSQSLLNHRKELSCKIENILDKNFDDNYLFILNEDVKTKIGNVFGFQKNSKYLFHFNLKTNMELEKLKIQKVTLFNKDKSDNYILFEKDAQQKDNTNSSNKLNNRLYQMTYTDHIIVYDTADESEIILNSVNDYMQSKSTPFIVEFLVLDERNLEAKITFEMEIASLHSPYIKIDMDGKCKLQVNKCYYSIA